jgi:hypothetical protein
MDIKRTFILCFGLFCVTAIVLACIFKGIDGAVIKAAFTLIGVVIGYGFNIVPAFLKKPETPKE